MNAFHSIWTEPSHMRTNYKMEDYNLLVMILSALNWRKYNGRIKLLADKYAIEYINKLCISHIWNGGIYELQVDSDINANAFWAAGKMYALKSQNEASIMLDTDLIVWKKIDEYINNSDIVVMHREDISDAIYPDSCFFRCKDEYIFNEKWDWNVKPCNTALLYIEDVDFKNYYVSKSIEFMKNSLEKSNDICNMVFAEQRIISMCAAEKKKRIYSILDYNNLNAQTDFTHIWGYKHFLKEHQNERRLFCESCINRILLDFPGEEATLRRLNLIM